MLIKGGSTGFEGRLRARVERVRRVSKLCCPRSLRELDRVLRDLARGGESRCPSDMTPGMSVELSYDKIYTDKQCKTFR